MLKKTEFSLPCTLYKKKMTLYSDPDRHVRARLFYFHGGGLLCGSREDLPAGHVRKMLAAGYEILAFDYPLAPAAKLDTILSDVCDSVNQVCANSTTDTPKPYFLWGRSSGAYLALLAAASGRLQTSPAGILSYYGYGLLCDGWLDVPCPFYGSLPPVSESCLSHLAGTIHADGDLESHYSAYVYARQTGRWKDLFYKGRDKFLYLSFSLRTCKKLPCPLFCAHSTEDPDVPFMEFQELSSRFHARRFIASGKTHAFDEDEQNPFTQKLLDASLRFLDDLIME